MDLESWIWNLAHEYFPGAVEIVDLDHARRHLWELAGKLFPNQEKRRHGWASQMERQLDQGRIELLVAQLRGIETENVELARQITLEADYFERNAARMRYEEFRRQGLFVRSGVIEAGCRTVIASRLKRSGPFWSVRGANAVTALRCCRLSGRFDDYWESPAPRRLSVTNLSRTLEPLRIRPTIGADARRRRYRRNLH